jgi:selenocysteine lyase/cysteine desulfurase
MLSQKHLFQLPDSVHYLNCGYMSPLLISVEAAGIKAMQQKRNPLNITAADFFTEAILTRELFGQLVNCSPSQVAIIPSASYGLQAAVNNLPADKGTFAITVADEFPSGYYSIESWCRKNNKALLTIKPSENTAGRGISWNEKILEAINRDTTAVVISSIHWMDGTIFNLEAIGKRCKENGAMLIVDGTQSVGALPIDVKACNIDVLVCAAYKWLMGPYSTGLAYYSACFNDGTPLEETWLNRDNAHDFSKLTSYTGNYTSGAFRYNMGAFSNFIQLPMLHAALTQIIAWKPEHIQAYCNQLIQPLITFLQENNFHVEEEHCRAKHLFGFTLPDSFDKEDLLKALQQKNISVSARGNAVRVSTHLFNTGEDIALFIEALQHFMGHSFFSHT